MILKFWFRNISNQGNASNDNLFRPNWIVAPSLVMIDNRGNLSGIP